MIICIIFYDDFFVETQKHRNFMSRQKGPDNPATCRSEGIPVSYTQLSWQGFRVYLLHILLTVQTLAEEGAG